MYVRTHSLTDSFTPSLFPSRTHSRTHSPPTHPPTQSLSHSLSHFLTHSLTHALSPSLTRSLADSFAPSHFTHARTLAFTVHVYVRPGPVHGVADASVIFLLSRRALTLRHRTTSSIFCVHRGTIAIVCTRTYVVRTYGPLQLAS